MAIQTVTYSTEVWALAKKQQERTKTAEMKVLRNVSSYTIMESTITATIRNIFKFNNTIRNNIYLRIRHMKRMELHRVPRHIADYIGLPEGRGTIERPKVWWREPPI
jgi:hypothetical protein